MAKKSEAKPSANGGADLPVSQDAQQRIPATKNLPRPSDGGIKGEGRPSSLLDTHVVYCGNNLEQFAKLPDACVDLIYIDPPFNSNRNYEVSWGPPREITPRATKSQCLRHISLDETKEKRAFEDRHENPRLTLTA